MSSWLLLIFGLALLIVGGELLVKAAIRLALIFRISRAVIGLTIVSLGTSLPELVVSVDAAVGGHPDISMGNVVGSNIANLALVLGATAMVFPVISGRSILKFEWPVMFASSILLVLFCLNGILEAWEGVLLVLALVAFNVYSIRKSRKEFVLDEDEEEVNRGWRGQVSAMLMLMFGIGLLIYGADWLVEGAVELARQFEVSERVIAITIVAFGTSAPELSTSLIAAFRKESSISLGNLLGSNIFNILGILGTTSIVHSIEVSETIISQDFIWMLLVAFILGPIMYFSQRFFRIEGLVLLAIYFTYMISLF